MIRSIATLALSAFFALSSCTESTKTSTEEKKEIDVMDSTEKVVKESVDKLEEQTKKVEETLEKIEKEFDENK
jgi:hypothetical protein